MTTLFAICFSIFGTLSLAVLIFVAYELFFGTEHERFGHKLLGIWILSLALTVMSLIHAASCVN